MYQRAFKDLPFFICAVIPLGQSSHMLHVQARVSSSRRLLTGLQNSFPVCPALRLRKMWHMEIPVGALELYDNPAWQMILVISQAPNDVHENVRVLSHPVCNYFQVFLHFVVGSLQSYWRPSPCQCLYSRLCLHLKDFPQGDFLLLLCGMCVFVWGCACPYVCMWRPEEDIRYLLLLIFTLVLKHGLSLSVEFAVRLGWLAGVWPVSPSTHGHVWLLTGNFTSNDMGRGESILSWSYEYFVFCRHPQWGKYFIISGYFVVCDLEHFFQVAISLGNV